MSPSCWARERLQLLEIQNSGEVCAVVKLCVPFPPAEAEGTSADANKLKTKVRRLYDIANILSSMHLLEKTQLPDSRKPAFRWLGIESRIAAAPSHTLKDFFR